MHRTVLKAFLLRGYREEISYRMTFAFKLLAAGFSLASFFYLARFINQHHFQSLEQYGGDYMGFGLVGMVLLNLQHTAASSYPKSIRAAQMAGTLEAILATPVPSGVVLIFTPVYTFVSAFIWAAIYLSVGWLFMDVHFGSANILSLLLSLPLCLLAFASLGFLGAAITMLMRRTDPISFVLGGLSSLLGGVFYPTSVLPSWLQEVGKLLPITQVLEIVRRATFTGATPSELASQLMSLALFCALVAPLGILLFGWTLRRARMDGSLNHF